MDLGLKGKSAIICASSKGLGKACAKALAQEGVDVWISGRTPETLTTAAAEIQEASDGNVHTVIADVTTLEGRQELLNACPTPDIVVNNAGGPPPGDFRDWDQQAWFDAINSNMFSAIDMIRNTIDGMIERKFGRIVNITSVAVKLPQAELGLSNGARAGLTGFIAGIAREPAQHNVTINNLLPGFIDTDRMRGVVDAKAKGSEDPNFADNFFNRIPAKRPGDPDEFGATCAFLCSQQAAYITAQNLLVDGGIYPGTL
ncbi:SDR family oxidoreductase [Kordiimonas sp. SCSIO 12610]|uniref:SDR family oxidoreductase n=1 Tax=Kordiimonas sp. SCSIO 12610 TaxID=2829597 RepID=UPI00210C813D|nr:SDR family oxidoreductase [Kordiimonas sp. SCSIO 12610]UTW54796.1 SDR family oxidoreductase [Kordiimonas sp. SCSIO 12610]